METNSYSNPQDTVDAESDDTTRKGTASMQEGQEREGGGRRTSCEYESEDCNLSNSSNTSNPLEQSELEARVRDACRRTCRRRLLVELFKTITKVAGVILAAMGLSSFGEED